MKTSLKAVLQTTSAFQPCSVRIFHALLIVLSNTYKLMLPITVCKLLIDLKLYK